MVGVPLRSCGEHCRLAARQRTRFCVAADVRRLKSFGNPDLVRASSRRLLGRTTHLRLDHGLTILLDDQLGTDLHQYGGNGGDTLSGTWAADGRNINPTSSGLTFDNTPRTALLNSFNGTDPNGVWTLYLADVAFGGQARLAGWSLEITAVPEPMAAAMAWFGLLFGLAQAAGWLCKRVRRGERL